MHEAPALLSINDFFGVPVVLAFFILLIKWLAPYYIKDPQLLRFFYWGLLLRAVGVVLSLLFYTYIEGYGDTFNYFTFAKKISSTFSGKSFDEIKNIFYSDYADMPLHIKSTLPDSANFRGLLEGNRFIIFTTAIISFFTFDSYVAISIVFTLFGYLGTWLIFYRLVKIYPQLCNYLFFFIICWPSSFFWGSGVMKEPLCLGCIGILFYVLFSLKARILSVAKVSLIAIPVSWFLYSIKFYLLASLGISFLIALIFYLISNIQQQSLKRFAYLCLSILFIFPFVYFFIYGNDLIASSVSQHLLDSILNTTKAQLTMGNSNYDLGKIELNPLGLARYLLASLNVALFGPYFFQINKFQLLISGGESFIMLLLLLFTLYKISVRKILSAVKNDMVLVFCFFFIIIVGFQIGAIAFNYGTLVRYKMPIVPFFFSFFIILLYKRKLSLSTIS